MPFKPGDPKPAGSGRVKGQLTKLASNVRAKLEELGCDPIEGMAKIAMDESNPQDLRHKAYSDLAQYAYPKLKAIDHTFGGSGTLNVNNTTGTELLTGRIAELAARNRVAPSDSEPDRGTS